MKYYVRVEILNEGDDLIWQEWREIQVTDSNVSLLAKLAELFHAARAELRNRLT